jgi:protein required for attachment to host cells
MMHFAQELADILAHGRATNQYQRLVLVASPHFLGMLLGRLTPAVQALLSDTVKKDFTRFDAGELSVQLSRLIVV